MTTLTCPHCGNTRHWRGAYQDGDVQTATCGQCGRPVTSRGGVVMAQVGEMTQTVRVKKSNKKSKR